MLLSTRDYYITSVYMENTSQVKIFTARELRARLQRSVGPLGLLMTKLIQSRDSQTLRREERSVGVSDLRAELPVIDPWLAWLGTGVPG